MGAWVDAIVSGADRDAVRRRRDAKVGRQISIWGGLDGISSIYGHLASADARLLDERLDALAGSVCADDPRSHAQRRADALGALAAGGTRLACRCGRSDCAAGVAPAPGLVVIHVVAERSALDGTGGRPAALAEFIRVRDLTCRFPGCDVPADRCDIDHTTPYAAGGPTHPSKVRCLCRFVAP